MSAPASDVWGLGVILFECLTARLPFRGETTAEIIYQIRNRETPSLRTIRPGIPRDLERICLKCLNKPLESRYRSVAELIEDLDCLLAGECLELRPAGGARGAGRPVGAAVASAGGAARRHRGLLLRHLGLSSDHRGVCPAPVGTPGRDDDPLPDLATPLATRRPRRSWCGPIR